MIAATLAGLIAIATAFLVQGVLVPQVESRKRWEERWEENVLKLGVLLVTEYADGVKRMNSALSSICIWNEYDTAPDMSAKLAVRRAEAEAKLEEATTDVDRVYGEAAWLIGRVKVASAPGMVAFLQSVEKFYLAHAALESLRREVTAPREDGEQVASAQVHEEHARNREVVRALREAVEALADGPIPRMERKKVKRRRRL